MVGGKYNEKLALELLKIAELPEVQLENNGNFPVPKGFRVLGKFKAHAHYWKKPDTKRNKKWFGFVLESEHSVITAFRGTKTFRDAIVDSEEKQVSFHETLVHRGFLSVYNSCEPPLYEIYDSSNSILSNKTLYITGHSLGAALATLHALDISLSNYKFKRIVMYNYASPRVGNPAFAELYNSRISNTMRFVNNYDIVPSVPHISTEYGGLKYRHVQPHVSFTLPDMHLPEAEQHYDYYKKKYINIPYNHSFDAYKRGIKKYINQ